MRKKEAYDRLYKMIYYNIATDLDKDAVKIAMDMIEFRIPKDPRIAVEKNGDVAITKYYCGQCNKRITYRHAFCQHCGQRTYWGGRHDKRQR